MNFIFVQMDGVGLAFRPRWHGGWTYVKHRQNRYGNGFEFYWHLRVATCPSPVIIYVPTQAIPDIQSITRAKMTEGEGRNSDSHEIFGFRIVKIDSHLNEIGKKNMPLSCW